MSDGNDVKLSLFDSPYKLGYAADCHASCTNISNIPAYENANSATTYLDLWVIDITSVELVSKREYFFSSFQDLCSIPGNAFTNLTSLVNL